MSSNLRLKILEALRAAAKGNIAKAKANVEVYLHQPVGIGEHPDVFEAMELEILEMAKNEPESLKAALEIEDRFLNSSEAKGRYVETKVLRRLDDKSLIGIVDDMQKNVTFESTEVFYLLQAFYF